MRKALTITLVAALALFAGSAAYANYCARDVVPASTILVPWAVQDMNAATGKSDPQGYTTILTITNVSKDAQIIHITVWNVLSEACLDFNEVLSGYDQWQIFFRDMIDGNFFQFDTRQVSSPTDTGNRVPFEWGPDGRSAYVAPAVAGLPVPEKASTTPTTNCQMPYNTINVDSNIACLRGPLTARSHYGCDVEGINQATKHFNVRSKFVNKDWLANLTDNPLFFYVTIDVVDQCNFLFPSDVGYFANRYLEENVLLGDIVYLSANSGASEAINAVHIESDARYQGAPFNFFYEDKADPADVSSVTTEPLATALAFDYYNGFQGVTFSSVMMWKNFHEIIVNPGEANDGMIDDCGPYLYYTWDQDEHTISRSGSCTVSPCNVNDIDPNEFPFETQMVPITNDNFDLAGTAGWMLVIFPPSYNFPNGFIPTGATGSAPDPTPPTSTLPYMAWAGLKISYGHYTAGIEAATMANRHCWNGQVQPQLGVNYQYPLVSPPPPTE